MKSCLLRERVDALIVLDWMVSARREIGELQALNNFPSRLLLDEFGVADLIIVTLSIGPRPCRRVHPSKKSCEVCAQICCITRRTGGGTRVGLEAILIVAVAFGSKKE